MSLYFSLNIFFYFGYHSVFKNAIILTYENPLKYRRYADLLIKMEEKDMTTHTFPKVKNVIVKRTKNGQRYLLHDKDSCGNDIYVTIPIVDTDTEKDYFRKIKECRIKLNAKKNGESITELIREYIERRQLAENSIVSLSIALRNFSLDNDNNIKQVKSLFNGKFKDSTIKVKLGYISSFFKWIILSNRVEGIVDPTLDFKMRHIRSVRTRTLTDNEESILIEKVRKFNNIETRLMIQFAFYTGARASSIYALKPDSIRNNKVYYFNVKTRKPYDYPVPIYDKNTIDLFNLLAERGYIFSKSLIYYTATARNFLFRLFGRDENGETISLHSLRHNFATKAIQRGIPAEIVARLLDHSSPTMTLKVYAKHSDKQLEDAILKMSE